MPKEESWRVASFLDFAPPPPFGEKAFKKNIYLNLRSALYNS